MRVEMLHTAACPNAALYLTRLRRLVGKTGATELVHVRIITDPDEARRERFLGSPTVRVDGRDVEPTADGRRDYGLTCRLYPGPEGPRGIPPDECVLRSPWSAWRSGRCCSRPGPTASGGVR